MKSTVRRAAVLLLMCFLLASVSPIASFATSGNGDVVVYITETGNCYHTESCGYLKSKIKTTLEEAIIEGYRRCSRCNPPIYTGDATPAPTEAKRSEAENGGVSVTEDETKATEAKTEPLTTQKRQGKESKRTTTHELLLIGVSLLRGAIAIFAVGCVPLVISGVVSGLMLVITLLTRHSERARRKRAKTLLFETRSTLKKHRIDEVLPPVERNKESLDRLCSKVYVLISIMIESLLEQNKEIVCTDEIVSQKGWEDNGAVYCVPGSLVYHVAKCQFIRLSNTATKRCYAINVAGTHRPCPCCKPPVPTPLMQEIQHLIALRSKWTAVLNWKKSAKK